MVMCVDSKQAQAASGTGTALPSNTKRTPKRGKFIIFDGPDGCGKGAMVKILFEALLIASPTVHPMLTKHPGGSVFGDEIRRVMFDTVGTRNIDPDALELLFLADHVDKRIGIEAALKDGDWVIADRWYTTSNPVYSYVREVKPKLSDNMDEIYGGVPHDTLFLMYGDPEVLLVRAQARSGSAIDGSHQAAKRWNTSERAKVIGQRFLDLFAGDERTVIVPADKPMTALQRFSTYVDPVIRMQGRLWFDYDALHARLKDRYPEDEGWLY